MQAGLTPVLTEALLAVGLLDPVSPQTGIRISEEILMILGNLAAVPLARASICCTSSPALPAEEALHGGQSVLSP